ncbi:MAG: hypothetical protein JWQ29_1685 [Phenylobacterium sp.]|nr:hypothetical protein [Phenylobacterium sp.]
MQDRSAADAGRIARRPILPLGVPFPAAPFVAALLVDRAGALMVADDVGDKIWRVTGTAPPRGPSAL